MLKIKNERKLAFASFLSQGAIVIFNFSLVYYLRECKIDSVGIGIASSLYPTFYFLGCIFMPRLFPRLFGKASILISLWGMAFTAIVLTLTKNAMAIFAILILYGLFQSLLWTNMETWITEGANGNSLTGRLTLFNFSWSFSVGLATSTAGFLSERSTKLSIYFGALLFIIASLIIISSKQNRVEAQEEIHEVEEDKSSLLRYPSWVGVFLVYTGYSLVLTVFPQYSLDYLGFSESITGNILLFRGISVTIAFLIMQRFRHWQNGFYPILLSQLSFAFLTLLMSSLTSVFNFSLVFALYGCVFALSYNLSIFHGAEGAKNRKKRMIIHEVLLTLGTIIGSLFGGVVYQYFSFQRLVYLISITSIAVLLIEFFLKKRWSD